MSGYKKLNKIAKRGDIILSTPLESILSDIIKWSIDGKYSHVSMYIGRGRVIESELPGVRIISTKKVFSAHKLLILRLHYRSNVNRIIKYLKTFLGLPYGFRQLALDFFLFLVYKISGKDFRNEIKSDVFPYENVCSEFIARAIYHYAGPVKRGVDPSMITPQDFYDNYRLWERISVE